MGAEREARQEGSIRCSVNVSSKNQSQTVAHDAWKYVHEHEGRRVVGAGRAVNGLAMGVIAKGRDAMMMGVGMRECEKYLGCR